ncbi:MAG: hypothetical protein AABW58_02290 [Nanoarchaeota archaeon]
MVETALNDDELKRIHGLEYLTEVSCSEGPRKIGFGRGKFVILDVSGSRSDDIRITIGDSFYETLREQAKRGDYRSAKEFFEAYVRKPEE